MRRKKAIRAAACQEMPGCHSGSRSDDWLPRGQSVRVMVGGAREIENTVARLHPVQLRRDGIRKACMRGANGCYGNCSPA
eukprot:scaffold141789_cov32-Tisochrysis_lutea.AAC.4